MCNCLIKYLFQVKEDCSLTVPYEDYNMPIPITANSTNPTIIYPDKNGTFIIKQFDIFRVVCSETKFQYPLNFNESDLTVKCLGKNLLEYDGKMYQWDKFKCEVIPKPLTVVTKQKCLSKYSIIKVGFNAYNAFLSSYKICYDVWTRNLLYAWYVVKTPHYNIRQISFSKPEFVPSRMFGDANINGYYNRQVSVPN